MRGPRGKYRNHFAAHGGGLVYLVLLVSLVLFNKRNKKNPCTRYTRLASRALFCPSSPAPPPKKIAGLQSFLPGGSHPRLLLIRP